MKAPIVTALLLATGCACPEAHELAMGGSAPAHADVVLSAAQAECGRPIVGRLEWTTEPRGDETGHCSWPAAGCPMDAWVWNMDPNGVDARETAMAHEIGHWCLRSEDEGQVQAWAAAVNAEASDTYSHEGHPCDRSP